MADEIEPLDANRDDMRAAANTVRLMAALIGCKVEELQGDGERLRRYLPLNQPDDDRVLTPEEAAAMKRNPH